MAKKTKTTERAPIARMNPKVDFYFRKAKKWKDELEQLRTIVLDTPLVEEVKWGVPCYTYDDHNVVLIHDFKDYCALLFVKGALLQRSLWCSNPANKECAIGPPDPFQECRRNSGDGTHRKILHPRSHRCRKSRFESEKKETSEYPVPEKLRHKLNTIPSLKRLFMHSRRDVNGATFFILLNPNYPKRGRHVSKNIFRILWPARDFKTSSFDENYSA